MSAPRKSRRARLFVSGTLGAPKEWSPTNNDWRRLEKAYGMPRGQHFDEGLRRKINISVREYFCSAPYESAPFVDDFIGKLSKARNLANELAKVVCSFGEAGDILAPHWQMYFPAECDEQNHVRQAPVDDTKSTLLQRILAQPTRRGCDYREFEEVVHTIGSALESALAEVKQREFDGFCEVDAWNRLVRTLRQAFKDRKMRLGLSNDPDRQSPFVEFFRALQSTFDAELRRHEPEKMTDSGLRKAISQAVKNKEKTGKRGGNLSHRKVDSLPQRRRKRV